MYIVCPSNIYGTNVIDLAGQTGTRNIGDFLYKKNRQDFERQKDYLSNGSMVSFDTIKFTFKSKLYKTQQGFYLYLLFDNHRHKNNLGRSWHLNY